MALYNLIYTDTGLRKKSIIRGVKNTAGSGNESSLQFTVVDDNGVAKDLTGFTTTVSLYVGSEGTIKVNGTTVTVVSAAAGTLIYRLSATDFATASEADCGTWAVEIRCVGTSKEICANGATLSVLPSIID